MSPLDRISLAEERRDPLAVVGPELSSRSDFGRHRFGGKGTITEPMSTRTFGERITRDRIECARLQVGGRIVSRCRRKPGFGDLFPGSDFGELRLSRISWRSVSSSCRRG